MRILPHSTVMPPLKMMGPMCWVLPRSLVLPLWAPQCWAIRPILWALNLQASLMALPYFPSNRSALAMMLWEDAGKPMPESELLYPDVGQEEQDMDLQHAARWAMENELIPDLNDEGTAPEEMKFFPANPVSKLDVLNAWQKAQELKNN